VGVADTGAGAGLAVVVVSVDSAGAVPVAGEAAAVGSQRGAHGS
jgi:hypothetical protein